MVHLGTLQSTKGYTINLGHEIGNGGEGAVYDVHGQPNVVAKIYRPTHITSKLETKIRTMVGDPPEDSTRIALNHVSIAWPIDVVTNVNGFVGFLMPKIGKSYVLYDLLQPKIRLQRHPAMNHAYIYRVARNLASAMDAIHRKGYVIGDVNDKNALFNHHALITLIDCDSMQVVDRQGTCHPCLVGVPEMMAPELHGMDFTNTQNRRTASSDEYTLAIIIFKLLMEGFHPFQGVAVGNEPDREQVHVYCMQQRIFPYITGQKYSPPPVAPGFFALPPTLRHLFMRAFTQPQRPSANEWSNALQLVEKRLVACKNNVKHMYPSDGHCVICEVQYNAKRMIRSGSAPARTESMPASISQAPLPSVMPRTTTPPVSVVSNLPVNIPTRPNANVANVVSAIHVLQIVAAGNYNVALCSDGSIIPWGAREFLQIPTGISSVLKLFAAPHRVYAVLSNGAIVSWGMPPSPILPSSYTWADVAAGSTEVLGLLKNGQVVLCDANGKVAELKLSDVAVVAMGDRHFVTLTTAGEVRAWGDNSRRQTDIPKDMTNIDTIVARGYCTGLIKANGQVRILHSDVRLSTIPSTAKNVTELAIAQNVIIALKKDQTLTAWGYNTNPALQYPTSAQDIKSIAAGDSHGIALRNDGKVIAWGSNSHGQCDVPSNIAG